jgi:hypothetical protein
LYLHIFVWECKNGPLVRDATVRYSCNGGTEGCARYEHLALAASGEDAQATPQALPSQRRLSAESVPDLRALWHAGNVTIEDLQIRFKASEQAIRDALAGRSWPCTGGPIAHFDRPRGERLWNARLTADAVRLIRRQHDEGMSLDDIAAYHGVSKSAVSLIVRRKRWAHI